MSADDVSVNTVDSETKHFAEVVGESDRVAVEGGRTRWSAGGALEEGVRLVRAPSGVIEYRPEEMIVRLRAGTTVRDLDQALREGGQRSALPDRGGTVGGALAVGENHLEALGRGTVRASLLRVRYVSAAGRVIDGGGDTVKNVSGYDLPRLMVGSLGTLGLIAEVTLRTSPVPPSELWLVSQDANPFDVSKVLFRPLAILWDGESTWVHLEGHSADVSAETAVLERAGAWEPAIGAPDIPPCRWSMEPADLRKLEAEAVGPFVASIGVGMVFSGLPHATKPPSEALRRLVERVKAELDPTGRLNPGRDPWNR